jgi:hypothetical protein
MTIMDLCVAGGKTADRCRNVLALMADTVRQRGRGCLTAFARMPKCIACRGLRRSFVAALGRGHIEIARFCAMAEQVLETGLRKLGDRNGLRRELCPFR